MSENELVSQNEIIIARMRQQLDRHINEYVLPQYGDYGNGSDPAKDYDVTDCVKQSARYLARHGRSSREGEEKRDLLKAIHWLSIAIFKMDGEPGQ